VSIRLLNCQTRNPSRSCISRSTSQSHSLSDSISQRASLFTYHLVRAGYSPVPSSRFTLITRKTLVNSPTDYASSGSGSGHRTVTFAELATEPTQLTSSRACHRHVTWKVDGHSAQSLVLVLGSSEKGKGCGVLDSVGGIMLPGQFVLKSDHLCKVRVARSCMVSTTLWRGNWFIQLPLQVSDLSFLFTLLIWVHLTNIHNAGIVDHMVSI
jgi:hypothetical protein